MRFVAVLLATFLLFISCQEPAEVNSMVKAYVTLQGVDKVAVIDVSRRKVVKIVDVDIQNTGDSPHYIVIDKTNGFWYVTLISSGYILKFDLETDELIDSVLIGNMPALMALDETSQTLYVSRFMPMPGMGMMSSKSTMVNMIDASTMRVAGSVDLGARSPHGIALSSDGSKLWVASNEASHFFKIETSRITETGYKPASFKLGSDVPDSYNINDMLYNALDLELGDNDSKLFVTCSGSDEVRVFNSSNGDSINAFNLSKQPWHLVLSRDHKTLFTTNRSGMSVSKIDLDSKTVSVISDSRIVLPHGCVLIPDESELLVSASGGNRILIINTKSMKLTDVINFEIPMSMPTGIAIFEE